MYNFAFQNPTKLIFGKDTIAQLSTEIPKSRKIMITYGFGSIFKNGVYDQVKKALEGYNVIEFGGIEANPVYETLMKAVATCKAEKVDFLLAVGGGSVLDGTKFIATAILFNGNPWDFMQNNALAQTAIPMGTVLTLPATGSEMNNGGVISRKETGEKLAFHNPQTYPQFSILDPQTTFSLPVKQIANGIVDTFVHVVEQYITYPVKANVQDRWAEGILLTLQEIGKKAVEKNDYDIMANFMFAATMGLNGFIAMGQPQDWATHMIGHELTAFHGLDHGVTLAIVLPQLLRRMKNEKREKLEQYAERVFGIKDGNSDERIEKAIVATEKFFQSVGVPTTLKEHGVTEPAIDKIVERFTQRKWILGEKQNITPQIVKEILEKCK